jgi:hypothetical protein
MHKHNFGLFIQTMIDILTSENLPREEKAPLFAYISGFLTHYALDADAHPYIYAKTGTRQKGDKARAIKYSVNHRKLETAIDVLMLKLMSSEKPSDYKLWQLIRVGDIQQKSVARVVNTVSAAIQSAYSRDVTPRDVYKAMAYMINLTRMMQSRNGRRKRLMELVENLTLGEHLFSSIIHMQNINNGVDYMNIEKLPWYVPGLNKNKKTDSFIELYQEGVRNGTQMVTALWQFMTEEITRNELLTIIGNRSLSTGATLNAV